MIVRFADYGFPRAHAAAYGVLAFQTAWLKANYPVPFMASMLASVTGNQRKTAEYVDECRRMGIEVLPPDVNESGVTFTPLTERSALALRRLRMWARRRSRLAEGTGGAAVREPARPMPARRSARRQQARAGIADSSRALATALGDHRAQLVAVLDETVEAALKWRKEREELQIELFGFDEVQNWDVEMPDVRPFHNGAAARVRAGAARHVLVRPSAWTISRSILERLPLDRTGRACGGAGGRPCAGRGDGRVLEAVDDAQRASDGLPGGGGSHHARRSGRVPDGVEAAREQLLKPGSLVIVQATVQHQDEDFKLILEDVVPLAGAAADRAPLAEQVRRL